MLSGCSGEDDTVFVRAEQLYFNASCAQTQRNNSFPPDCLCFLLTSVLNAGLETSMVLTMIASSNDNTQEQAHG